MKKILFLFFIAFATSLLGQEVTLELRTFTKVQDHGFNLPTEALTAKQFTTCDSTNSEGVATFYVTAFNRNAAVVWQGEYQNLTVDYSGGLLTLENGNATLYLWGTPKRDKTKRHERPRKAGK